MQPHRVNKVFYSFEVTCKCHADVLIQGTYFSDSPFFLQLCNGLFLNTKYNNVFTSNPHLCRIKELTEE